MNNTLTQLAKDLNMSYNTIKRALHANKALHKYVVFNTTFKQIRITILKYNDLKEALLKLKK